MKIRADSGPEQGKPPDAPRQKKNPKIGSRWREFRDGGRIVAQIQLRGRTIAVRGSEPEWSTLVRELGWPVKNEHNQATVVVPLPLLGSVLTTIGRGSLEEMRNEKPGWRELATVDRQVHEERQKLEAELGKVSNAKDPNELVPEQRDLFGAPQIRMPEVPTGHPFHQLRPYQQAGVALLLAGRMRFVLGDEMGLGKTCQSLVSIDISDADRVLVVCPKVVARNWIVEAETWAPSFEAEVASSGAKIQKWCERERTSGGRKMLVVTWGLLEGSLEDLAGFPWSSVVADEEHQAKEISTGRTRALLAISYGARHRIGVTGTPMLNRPAELFPLLHFVDPIAFPRFIPFGERYGGPRDTRIGGGRTKREYRGASHELELNRIVRPFLIRRTKIDVLHDLPPRIEKIVHVDCDKGLAARCDAIRIAIRIADNDGQALGELVKLRQEVGLAKVGAAVEMLVELVAADERVIVFVSHHPVREAIEAALDAHGIGHAKIIGETSGKQRQTVKESFQRGEIPVLIGSEAMRDGVTLTRAAVSLHPERWYTPAGEDQAMSRIHRFGQTRETLHVFFHLDGSLDDWFVELLETKGDRIRKLFERQGGDA
jgi:SWI/SNF-related matrix-associated actin-dependent regulator 1 of chromatin subfamily A